MGLSLQTGQTGDSDGLTQSMGTERRGLVKGNTALVELTTLRTGCEELRGERRVGQTTPSTSALAIFVQGTVTTQVKLGFPLGRVL